MDRPTTLTDEEIETVILSPPARSSFAASALADDTTDTVDDAGDDTTDTVDDAGDDTTDTVDDDGGGDV